MVTEGLNTGNVLAAMTVLLGFQTTAITWRLNRELQYRDKAPEGSEVEESIALADYLVLGSLVINVTAMFCLLLGKEVEVGLHWFIMAVILMVSHPIALVAHYRMFSPTKNRAGHFTFCTELEVIIVCVSGLFALFYGVAAFELTLCVCC